MIVKSITLRLKRSGLSSQFCYLIAVYFWAGYLIFLDINFPLYSVGQSIPIPQGSGEDEDNVSRTSGTRLVTQEAYGKCQGPSLLFWAMRGSGVLVLAQPMRHPENLPEVVSVQEPTCHPQSKHVLESQILPYKVFMPTPASGLVFGLSEVRWELR